ncbi:peptide deformylase [Buchnera aphidicola (Pemphigus obesinymphae)]|uniref:peptide deformylase n=1 Tax=Buchnera aphidicola TaxID=9 RepID=UPI002237B5D3|nr:peptide deformylase [Buchnera aphidicola]MCW5196392.1 peptide deformylase [Buchnera aphidicola (Pemphigus obesinymphae)]
MTILKILQYPDKNLRITAKPVKEINNNIRNIVNDMFETMYSEEGIGLAATQVDIPLQIIVISNIHNYNKPLVLINPEIISTSGEKKAEEGCLSIPKQRAIITRYEYIKINYLDYFGEKKEIKTNSLLSICIQHEMDHLIGKLFIDHLSLLKQKNIRKKIKKMAKKNDLLLKKKYKKK